MDLESLGIKDGEIVDAAKSAVEQGRELVPWLEDPHVCQCGAYCEADTQHVDTAGYVGYCRVWDCPECDRRYFRERV